MVDVLDGYEDVLNDYNYGDNGISSSKDNGLFGKKNGTRGGTKPNSQLKINSEDGNNHIGSNLNSEPVVPKSKNLDNRVGQSQEIELKIKDKKNSGEFIYDRVIGTPSKKEVQVK